MASNGHLDPQLPSQTHKIQPLLHHQQQYPRFESEPDSPLPSSLNPASVSPSAYDAPADKVTQLQQQQHPSIASNSVGHVDSLSDSLASLDASPKGSEAGTRAGSEAGAGSESGLAPGSVPAPVSRSSSPPAVYPSYVANLHELSAASMQYFPTFSASPAKLDHLQNLMSTLHKIMSDQSFAMGDLKAQVDEIQDVLSRVSSKKDDMTTEERQILQNAQMMKDLAKEVVSSNPAPNLGTGIEDQEVSTDNTQPEVPQLTLAMLSSRGLTEPTETPPPTATTPPPGLAFQPGYLRHRSSTTSFVSSTYSDRQYTQDGEEHPSRPSSVASSYRNQHRKKSRRQSMRQLEPLNSKRSSQVDQESNEAFDRICSLLTELITDASTAVSTAPEGSQQVFSMVLPPIEPLVPSDSESSSDSASDEEDAEDTNSIGGDNEDETEKKRSRIRPEIVPRSKAKEVEVELEPEDRYRTGITPRLEKSTKRLSSLFMELQNTPAIQDAAPKDDYGRRRQYSDVSHIDRDFVKERVMRRPRHSISSVSISSARSSRPSSMYLSSRPTENAEGHDSCESAPDSPLLGRRPRHRDSMSSLRSEPMVRRMTMESEVHKGVDAELDRTVETIDGLTRDLVAVATHQNLMQIRLQKTLQFQKEQVQLIERAHSTKEAVTPASASVSASVDEQTVSAESRTEPSSSETLSDQQDPLADLSKSLKQVAVSVRKVIASSAKKNTRTAAGETRSEGLDNTGFSRRDFSRYFQELEKVAALGSRFGFGKEDKDGIENETLFNTQDQAEQQGLASSTFKGSSKSPSCRNSTATLVGDELGFSLEEQPKVAHLDDSEFAQEKSLTTRSRSDSSTFAPPELEDFAAQCRLLTKALVLPFIQLTHHAMTSQDSVLALNPRSVQDLDSTLNIVEDLESTLKSTSSSVCGTRSPNSGRSSRSTSPMTSASRSRRDSSQASVLSHWSSHNSESRGQDSVFKSHGELPSDVVVKAKAFFSTGLYLLHLLYWTVLFVVGTIVLDPWLAENAGQQVVRIVDDVRDTIGKDGHSSRRPRLQQQQQQQPQWKRVGPAGSGAVPSESRRTLGTIQSSAAWAVAPRHSDVDVRRKSM
ncbi:MAG: hypothetical protein J3Q66DRAFT_346302 [Benniella sp.]|nr:MAG: hypothetical protein J3Q66DRAFT_346302 [Benniella sp.]